MATKIYPGVSAFFANRAGNHSWLANHARPFLSVTYTAKSGKRSFDDLFLNGDINVTSSDKAQTVKAPANCTVLIIPNNLNRPLFNIAHK